MWIQSITLYTGLPQKQLTVCFVQSGIRFGYAGFLPDSKSQSQPVRYKSNWLYYVNQMKIIYRRWQGNRGYVDGFRRLREHGARGCCRVRKYPGGQTVGGLFTLCHSYYMTWLGWDWDFGSGVVIRYVSKDTVDYSQLFPNKFSSASNSMYVYPSPVVFCSHVKSRDNSKCI